MSTRRRLNTRTRLSLRAFEERVTPAAFLVNLLGDAGTGSAASGDLRYCVNQSNTTAGFDTITFDATLFASAKTIDISTGGTLVILDAVSIQGPGTDKVSISGGGTTQVFNINPAGSGKVVDISGLTIRDGYSPSSAGGILIDDDAVTLSKVTITANNSDDRGGGISVGGDANLTIVDSTISGNSAFVGGGGLMAGGGAGTINVLRSTLNDNSSVYGAAAFYAGYAFSGKATIDSTTISSNDTSAVGLSGGALAILNSTISGNTARFSGGAINQSGGELTLFNSTVANNSARLYGGGISLFYAGSAKIANTTITGNSAGRFGGGVSIAYNVGGYISAEVSSTIITGNGAPNGPDAFAEDGFDFTGNNNLIGVYDPTNYVFSGANNKTGSAVAPLLAFLSPLSSFGGLTSTAGLGFGSPAINAGLDNGLPFDQRGNGFPRKVGPSADIGAFEGTLTIPVAASGVGNVTTPGFTTFSVPVTYVDDIAINLASIDINDVTVTGVGFTSIATPTSVAISGTGTKVTATYTFAAPGGFFDFMDLGGYQVHLVANQVFDTDGPNAALATTVGFFSIVFPVTLTVDTTADVDDGNLSAGNLSLREALRISNDNLAFDTILFSPTVFSTKQAIDVSALGTLVIQDPVTLTGPGADLLTLSGGKVAQVLSITGSNTIATTVSKLRIADGFAFAGGGMGIYSGKIAFSSVVVENNQSGNRGGGIYIQGPNANVTITDSLLNNNKASVDGGAIYTLISPIVLNVVDSTISNNSAPFGGGIYGNGDGSQLTSDGSTWSNNSATYGGAICNTTGIVILRNSTLTGNTATQGGAIYTYRANSGDGITISNSSIVGNAGSGRGNGILVRPDAKVTINSSIVANNFGPTADIAVTTTAIYTMAGDNNLIGSYNPTNITLNGANNLTGSVSSPLDPLLLPLGNYGGKTATRPLSALSPALNKGANSLNLTFDQRGAGFPRVVAGTADIGATEGISAIPAGFSKFSDVTSTGGANYLISVDYIDDLGVSVASIGTGDLTVTGPFGFTGTPTLVSTSGSGQKITATYSFTPPGGNWDIFDGGTYTVALNANQIVDTDATPQFAAAGSLGSFRVGIAGTISVDTVIDESDGNFGKGDVSLREAIAAASTAILGASTVAFDATLFGQARSIDIGALGLLKIGSSMVIQGPGANLLTVSGGKASVVFAIDDGSISTAANVAISGIKIIDGNGAVSKTSSYIVGGGIFINNEAVVLDGVWINGCSNPVFGGGAVGLFNSAALTVRNSTFTNNTAPGSGGAIRVSGESQLSVLNSTVSGNSAGFGGGIFVASSGANAKISIQNSTVTANSAANKAGGGGVFVSANTGIGIDVESSIVADNTSKDGVAPDFNTGTFMVNAKNSIIGVADSGFVLNDLGGNYAGTKAAPLSPGLWPLAAYGGKLPTHALKAGSPALNHGSNPTGLTTDARGFARLSGINVDIGAYESAPVTAVGVTVNDGSAQRSMVTSITIQFSEPVTLAADAFALARTFAPPTGGAALGAVNLDVAQSGNSVTLTFAGGGAVGIDGGKSLLDGNYQLTLSASKITGVAGQFDGNGDGVGGDDRSVGVKRLFGDADGDGDIDANDFFAFRLAVGTGSSIFDSDGDGDTDNADFVAFRARFGTTLP